MGVPSNVILPFMGVEFDSSRAFSGPANMPVKALLIGQKLAAGTALAETQYTVTSADQVANLAGAGSMLHRMAIKWFRNNQTTDAVIIALADAVGTQATQKINISGTASANGELDLYVNGDRFAVAVTEGDDADDIGAAVVAAITADPFVGVTAAYLTGVVTLTARNKGVAAGDIDARLNYYAGEQVPAGVTVAIGDYAAGTVDPDVQDALAVVGDVWFNVICSGYPDATNMGALEDFLEAQAGPMVQKDGVFYVCKKDTRANLITFATNSGRNSQFAVLIAGTSQPAATFEIAAAYAARVAESIQDDPAVPLHRMTLTGILPVGVNDRWTLIERNQLALSGVATLSNDNGVQTEATVTMYLKNSAGAADIAYQFQNTLFILMRLRYRFVNRILTRYPRAKLADNADRVRSGQQIITPDVGRAEALAWFLEEEADGQVENVSQFKKDLVCRRSTVNPNRLEWLLPPDLINQFITGSGDLQFLLQAN